MNNIINSLQIKNYEKVINRVSVSIYNIRHNDKLSENERLINVMSLIPHLGGICIVANYVVPPLAKALTEFSMGVENWINDEIYNIYQN